MERPLFQGVRPFTYVPTDGKWWEYFVFGVSVAALQVLPYLSMLGTFIYAPIVIPAKLLIVYTFGPNASLVSAVIALPLLLFCVTVLFAYAYLAAIARHSGSIVVGGRRLFKTDTGSNVGWLPDAIATYQFSAMTLLGMSEGDRTAEGVCRWIVILELVIGKVLELLVASIGIGLILGRLPRASLS